MKLDTLRASLRRANEAATPEKPKNIARPEQPKRTMEDSAFCPFPAAGFTGKRRFATKVGDHMEEYFGCGNECPMTDCDSVDIGVGIQTGNHVYTCPEHGDWSYDVERDLVHFRDGEVTIDRSGKVISPPRPKMADGTRPGPKTRTDFEPDDDIFNDHW